MKVNATLRALIVSSAVLATGCTSKPMKESPNTFSSFIRSLGSSAASIKGIDVTQGNNRSGIDYAVTDVKMDARYMFDKAMCISPERFSTELSQIGYSRELKGTPYHRAKESYDIYTKKTGSLEVRINTDFVRHNGSWCLVALFVGFKN